MIKSKQYLLWLTTDTLLLLSSQIRAFIIPILIITMGGSATDAASLAAFSQFMIVLFILPGGLIIDRFNRRTLLLIFSITSIAIFILFILMLTILGYNLIAFYIFTALSSIKGGLLGNTSNVMLPSVVEDKDLPEALSANQARDSAVSMIASPFSALLLSISRIFPFVAMIVANVVSFFATLGLKNDIPKRVEKRKNHQDSLIQKVKNYFKEATIGRKIVTYDKFMLYGTITSVLGMPFINGIGTMLLYHITQQYGVFDASLINTVSAISTLIGSIIATIFIKRFTAGQLIMGSYIVVLGSVLGSILAPGLVTKLGFIALQYIMFPCTSVVFGSLLMQVIGHDLLGRYQSFMVVITYGVTIPIQLFVGIVYDQLGFVYGALVYFAFAVLFCAFAYTKPLRSVPKASELDEFIEEHRIVL